MTVNVQNVLNKINNNKIFNDELYFVGGTALAYYLNHRISEDIDIVSANTLKYKQNVRLFEMVDIQLLFLQSYFVSVFL